MNRLTQVGMSRRFSQAFVATLARRNTTVEPYLTLGQARNFTVDLELLRDGPNA